MSDWLLFGLGLLLTAGTGIFVASEFALVNLDRAVLQARHDRGEKGLAALIAALRHTSTHLSSAQLGITLTTLLTGYTMEPAVSRLLSGPLVATGLPGDVVRPVATVVAVALATLLSMIFGELVPKNLALALPELTGRLVAPLQIAFTTVFGPFVRLLNGFSNMLVRAFGVEPQEELSSARTVEELASLVRHSASEGSLDPRAATLLTRTLDFAEFTAGDVMTPRTRMNTLPATATAADVVALARDTGHSRFPITGTGIDDVVGVVHVKGALAVPREERDLTPVTAFMRQASFVPDTQTVDVLLGHLRGGGQLAVVLDEYGGVEGLVTLTDILEELVGSSMVAGEGELAEVEVLGEERWRVSGGTHIDDVLKILDVPEDALPSDPGYHTLGGFMAEKLGRVPQASDEVFWAGYGFYVESMDALRVDQVEIYKRPDEPVDEPGEAADE